MKSNRMLVFLCLVVPLVLLLAGCPTEQVFSEDTTLNENSTTDEGDDPILITYSTIEGITTPSIGRSPPSSISHNDQYTGTVQWSPNDTLFEGHRVYTATISLSPRAGYTFAGITHDFFQVVGADSVTYDTTTQVVTAIFPSVESVGSLGPAGGVIFFDKGDKNSRMWFWDTETSAYIVHETKVTDFVWRYLEVAPSSTEKTYHWGKSGARVVPDANETAVGGGMKNSEIIRDYHDELDNYYGTYGDSNATIAAKYCLDLVYPNNEYNPANNKDDWYLPSLDELRLLYQNLKAKNLGNFSNEFYYSSTEHYDENLKYEWVKAIDFTSGDEKARNKIIISHRTRPIRAF